MRGEKAFNQTQNLEGGNENGGKRFAHESGNLFHGSSIRAGLWEHFSSRTKEY
jgi:hypothetical protein